VRWLGEQRTSIPIHTTPAAAPEATAKFGHLPDYGADMIVAADDGRLWVGPPDAYLVVMWALPELRALSYFLAIGPLQPLVGRIFQLVAGNRHELGAFLRGESCAHCVPRRGSRVS
jgi:predicted DCC family thiol-disulfide oxidoreductase YuxK